MVNEDLPEEVTRILNGQSAEEVAIKILYKNWRGEEKVRNVIPLKVWRGFTEYHSEKQWLLKVYDLDKKDFRDYALKDWKGSPTVDN